MSFPCDNAITCLPCPTGNPLRNTSAEEPDPADFFAVNFYPGNPGLNSPPGDYTVPVGYGVCYASTQQAANDCALRTAQDNAWAPWRTPSGGAVPIFLNTAQSCTVPCGDGAPFSYTVPAGTFQAHSQAEADAIAASYCQNRAIQARVCPPLAITQDATNVTDTTATLNGVINPNNIDELDVTVGYFEWGTTTGYGNLTPLEIIGSGTTGIALSANISGLTPGTYHFRVVAINALGMVFGNDKSFTIAAACVDPLFWDLGPGAQTSGGIANSGGKALNKDTSNKLNYFDGAVLNSDIAAYRLASDAGATVTQTAFVITSDISFFLPGDVNKYFEWSALGLRYQILEYLSDTQVRVDTSNTIGTNRNSGGSGITGTQTLDIATASGAFFLPSDVGATLTWDVTLDSLTIIAYISPTQVQLGGSISEGAQTFSVVLIEDGAVEAYSIGGTLSTARVNANGDMAVAQDNGGLKLIRYKPSVPGRPFILVAGASVGRINSAGNILGTNSHYYYADGTDVALGFTPALFIGLISGRDTARFLAQTGDKILEGSRNFSLGQNLRIWDNGVFTNLTFSPMPAAPHFGANQTLSGHCMSPNGSCICDALGWDAASGNNQNFFFILDPSGYSVQLSAPVDGTPGTISTVRCINDSKIGVGSISQASGFGPCIISAAGVVTAIPYLPGNTGGEAVSVNASGTVVGYMNAAGVNTAFLYKDGVTHDLNDYLPAAFKVAGWYLSIADTISDDNYVWGRGKLSGVDHTFLLCIGTI